MLYIFLLFATTQLFCAASSSSSATRSMSLKAIFIAPAKRTAEHDNCGHAETCWRADSIPGLSDAGRAVMISRKLRRPDEPFRKTLEASVVNLIPLTLAKYSSKHIDDVVQTVIARVNEKLLTRFLIDDKVVFNYILAVEHGAMRVFFKVSAETSSMPIPLPTQADIQRWKPGTYFADRVESVALEIHR